MFAFFFVIGLVLLSLFFGLSFGRKSKYNKRYREVNENVKKNKELITNIINNVKPIIESYEKANPIVTTTGRVNDSKEDSPSIPTFIKKYKQLYDSGVIALDEFNQKKKELLSK